MKTEYRIKLTKTQIEHLLTLINHNEEQGWYYAPKEQYWHRSNIIKKKLEEITKNIYYLQK